MPQLSHGTIDKSNSRSDRICRMYAHRTAIKGGQGRCMKACHARCTFVYTGVARMSGRAQLASYLSLGGECRGVWAATSHRVARATRLRLCFLRNASRTQFSYSSALMAPDRRRNFCWLSD